MKKLISAILFTALIATTLAGCNNTDTGNSDAQFASNSKVSVNAEDFIIKNGILKEYKGLGSNVVIPNSVTDIDYEAFKYCQYLTSITIPNSVTDIDNSTFAFLDHLTDIVVNADNATYCSVDGVLYTKDKLMLICCPCGKRGSVTIPDSVIKIGFGAFDGCTSLTDIFVNADNTNYCSIDGVLYSKDKATLFYCPEGKRGSVTIPNGVIAIDLSSFYFCANLTSVIIPNSVTKISHNAFKYCTSLTDIVVNADNATYCSVDGMLYSKDKVTLIRCPCGKRGSVTIPNSVTEIDDEAFDGCTSLTSITIQNGVTLIGEYMFASCTNLTSIIIPSSVTKIDSYAFEYCKSLTSVIIPNSVTQIGYNAFEGCTSLTDIVVNADNATYCSVDGVLYTKDKLMLICCPCGKSGSVTIPNSVTKINYKAFDGCTSLTDIVVNADNTNYCSIDGLLYLKDKATLIRCPGGKSGSVTIPNSIIEIEDGVFKYCNKLTSVTIPSSVTVIGSDVFDGCDNLTVIGYAGTIAQTYAKENGFKFKLLGAAK